MRIKLFRQSYILPALLVAVGLTLPMLVWANPLGNFIAEVLYNLFIVIPGFIMVLITRVLVEVVQYQGFGDEPIINKGWTVLRDLGNMFFIVILLLIALGTIVKSTKYGYQSNLRRLILMAILINFSKTITLFFIDLSQAALFTFVNAFKDQIQLGFPQMLGMTEVMNFQEGNFNLDGGVSIIDVIAQIGLGAIMLIVACVVIGAITVVFFLRIIYLAFIIILSPIAFAVSTLPSSKKYYDRWWDTLGKYLVVGPAMAFFLWLGFAVLMEDKEAEKPYGTLLKGLGGNASTGSLISGGTKESTTAVNVNTSMANMGDQDASNTTADLLKRYFVGIVLLMGSLTIVNELGVAGGSIAKAASGKIQGAGMSVLRGRSGAGGVLGLTRGIVSNVVAKPIELIDRKGLGAISNLAGRVGASVGGKAGGAIGGMVGSIGGKEGKERGRAAGERMGAQAGRITGKAAAHINPFAVGSTVYGRAAREFQAYDRGQKAKDVAAKMQQVKNYSDGEKRAALDSTDRNMAAAAAADLSKSGYADTITDDNERKRVKKTMLSALADGGTATEDQHKEMQMRNLALLPPETRAKLEKQMMNEGTLSKYLPLQEFNEELIESLVGAGATKKDFEDAGKRMTRTQKKGYTGAIQKSLITLSQQAADATNPHQAEAIEQLRDRRIMGARVDSKNAHVYAADLSTPANVEAAFDPARTVSDPAALQSIAKALTAAQIGDMDATAAAKYAPHTDVGKLRSFVRLGIAAEKLKAMKQSIEDEVTRVRASGATPSANLQTMYDEVTHDNEAYRDL